jgi:hypothetical protein
MPTDDIDCAALAVVAEGPLDDDRPSAATEHPHDPSHDRRVSGVKKTVELRAPPTRRELEPGAQRCSHGAAAAEPDRLDVTLLEERHHLLADARTLREVDLPPTTLSPKSSDDGAGPLVVHAATE